MVPDEFPAGKHFPMASDLVVLILEVDLLNTFFTKHFRIQSCPVPGIMDL